MALRLRRVWQSAAVEPGSPSITAQKVALQRLTFERVPAPYGDPDSDIALARDVASGSTGRRPEPAQLVPRGPHVVLRSRGRAHARRRAHASRHHRSRVRRSCVPLREARRPLVRGRSSRDADGQARSSRSARHRQRARSRTSRPTSRATTWPRRSWPPDSTPPAPTVFICEGVAVYLERPVLVALLRAIRQVAAPSSRLRGELLDDARQRRSRGSPGVVPPAGRGGRRARARSAHAR